jgi:hypothetical protein
MKNLCTNVLNNNRLNKSNDIIVRTYLKNNLSAHGAVLRNGSKCSHTTCMLLFFTVSRLALNTNLIFEIGSSVFTKSRVYALFSGVNALYTGSLFESVSVILRKHEI